MSDATRDRTTGLGTERADAAAILDTAVSWAAAADQAAHALQAHYEELTAKYPDSPWALTELADVGQTYAAVASAHARVAMALQLQAEADEDADDALDRDDGWPDLDEPDGELDDVLDRDDGWPDLDEPDGELDDVPPPEEPRAWECSITTTHEPHHDADGSCPGVADDDPVESHEPCPVLPVPPGAYATVLHLESDWHGTGADTDPLDEHDDQHGSGEGVRRPHVHTNREPDGEVS